MVEGKRMAVQTEAPQRSITILGGIVTILFGLIAVLWPHITLPLLIIFFGAFAFGYGAVSLVEMFQRMGRHETWWPSLVIGIIGIIAGLYVLTNLAVSAVILTLVIAVWALVDGITEVIGGIATGHFMALIIGMLTVVFGLILLDHPTTGALALVLVIGVFAIVRGILMLLVAFRLPSTPAAPA
jgi:uncharacterized membrane protein HdeD (DUF308 family)